MGLATSLTEERQWRRDALRAAWRVEVTYYFVLQKTVASPKLPGQQQKPLPVGFSSTWDKA